jgi:4-hydroxyphenylpyruvate dioxygenase
MAPAILFPYSRENEKSIFPESLLGPDYVGFDYITWYVGNAKQAASFYITRMGFKHIAYRGPETGSRIVASYVIRNGNAIFVLTSPIRLPPGTGKDDDIPEEEKPLLREIHEHLTKHGDGVKDVAFQINGDVAAVWKRAVDCGAVPISSPRVLKDDAGHGGVSIATIGTYGDTVHSLVNRQGYTGAFLPGYESVTEEDPINRFLPMIDFIEIDHCVGNQPWHGVDDVVK